MMNKWRVSLFAALIGSVLGVVLLVTGPVYAVCPDDIISLWTLDESSADFYADSVSMEFPHPADYINPWNKPHLSYEKVPPADEATTNVATISNGDIDISTGEAYTPESQSGLYAMEDAIMNLQAKDILVVFTDLHGQPLDLFERFNLIEYFIF